MIMFFTNSSKSSKSSVKLNRLINSSSSLHRTRGSLKQTLLQQTNNVPILQLQYYKLMGTEEVFECTQFKL